jgi:hypothetical protein
VEIDTCSGAPKRASTRNAQRMLSSLDQGYGWNDDISLFTGIRVRAFRKSGRQLRRWP